MWLPTPIYERVPQFWFLLGLLFVASGLYVGFEIAISFFYVAIGTFCCAWGIGIFVMRLKYRTGGSAERSEPVAEESQAEAPQAAETHAAESDPVATPSA